MKLWIGFVLPKKAFKEIVSVQKEISRKYDTYRSIQSRIGPHFTLTYQPIVKESNLIDIEESVKQISKQIKPFKVETQSIARFFNSRALYVKVIKSEMLNKVHLMLSYKVRKYGKIRLHNSFTPHVTIAYDDITDENLSKAFSELRKIKFHYKFTFDRIYLAKGKHRTKVYKSFKI